MWDVIYKPNPWRLSRQGDQLTLPEKLMMMTYLWVGIWKPDNVGCPGGKTTNTPRGMDVEDTVMVDKTEDGDQERDDEAHNKISKDVGQCQENEEVDVSYNRLENPIKVPARRKKKMHSIYSYQHCVILSL